MSMIEELLDHPVQDVLQPLADVYREWELKVDDPRFCHVQSQLKIEKVRKVQAFVLLLLLKGSSVLLLARTGWGKSLIFQGLRYAALKESDGPQESRHITVIFVPLSGLGQEQADEINEKAGSDVAIFYDKTKVDDRHLLDIRNGRYSWVLISPEKALHPKTVKMLWENVDFREKMLLFAVDEGHLVVEW
jgi:superfamily II DNA helicase RecQ